jgi:hypothetical protein
MNTVPTPFRLVAVMAATATVTAAATIAFANHEPWHKVYTGGGPNKTIVVTGEQRTRFTTNDWENVNGARAEIRVADGQQALLVMRFTAETACFSGAVDFCSARIMVDDRQARPASGRNFHIDSYYANETSQSQKAHAFDRSLKVGPGVHVVKVQGTTMGNTILDIDDWSLTVERVPT